MSLAPHTIDRLASAIGNDAAQDLSVAAQPKSGRSILSLGVASFEETYCSAVQSDGRILIGGAGFDIAPNSFFVARFNTDGTLDTRFGTSGVATVQFVSGNLDEECWSLQIQANGKILAVGISWLPDYSDSSLCVARLNINGSLDTTYGTSGILTFKGGGTFALNGQSQMAAIDGNGKLVIVASDSVGGIVARVTTAGVLDATFGTGGKVDEAGVVGYSGVAIQSSGKILAFGSKDATHAAIGRYTTAGVLDTTFGTAGFVSQTFTGVNSSTNFFNGLIQSSGKILGVGSSIDGSGNGFLVVARYSANGVLDTTFGNSGVYIGTDSQNHLDNIFQTESAILQSDDGIIITGYMKVVAESPNARPGFVLRMGINGMVDFGWGTYGIKALSLGSHGVAIAYDVKLLSNGGFVVAGITTNSSAKSSVFLAKLNKFGDYDSSFGVS